MRPRILVMDDDPSICRICEKLLNRLGYDADTTPCGEEAVALYSAAIHSNVPYTAVILDLSVQAGMGGAEVVRKLQDLNPAVYAIMASGSSVEGMFDSFQSLGFKAVLPKPYRIQDITICMQHIPAPGN